MGQGNTTAYVQIAAEIFNIKREDIKFMTPDSKYTLDSGAASASRTTYIYGKALEGAALVLKDRMLSAAAKALKEDNDDLKFEDGKITGKSGFMTFGDLYNIIPEEKRTAIAYADNPVAKDKHEIGHGLPHIIYSYSAHMALAEVDALTGKVTILKYIAATECGKVLNPQLLKGQIQGERLRVWDMHLVKGSGLKTGKCSITECQRILFRA